jgi:hypothetical protein
MAETADTRVTQDPAIALATASDGPPPATSEEPLIPFVGPRPFRQDDRNRFHGRERESRELLSLVIANRLVLLYAASGAGKTSLLSAGLIPALEQEETFDVLGPVRIGTAISRERLPESVANVYAYGLISNLTEGLTHPPPGTTLVSYLSGLKRRLETEGFRVPRALIIDQLEELFTVHPELWEQRSGFVNQIAEALEADPLLRVVLAIREDRLAELVPLEPLFPGGLHARLRIERLDAGAALQAVVEPLRGTGRSFASGAAEKLVADLRTFRVDTGSGRTRAALGEFVEPVQLQVTCRSLWEALPPEVVEITEGDLLAFADVDQVLADFYASVVSEAARAGHLREGRLREWIQRELITSIGTRGTQHRAAAIRDDVSAGTIAALVNRHLLRAEWRSGTEWYELTHDRLIAPIQASNAAFRAAASRRRFRWALTAVGVLAGALAVVAVAISLSPSGTRQASLPPVLNGARVLVATIRTPKATSRYLQGSVVRVSYSCAAVGQGVKRCSGTAPDGAPLNTQALGARIFRVTAIGDTGGVATQSVPYVIVPTLKTRPCGRAVAAGPDTSCPFARNVQRAYERSAGGTIVVTAFSPQTLRTYRMQCTAGSPHICTGGIGAAVFFP